MTFVAIAASVGVAVASTPLTRVQRRKEQGGTDSCLSRQEKLMLAQPIAELSRRDLAILHDLARVRLLSGRQLERLHFADLSTASARGSSRRRALGRLVRLGLITTLPRRVGGERAGSAGHVYSLDSGGHRLLTVEGHSTAGRIRRPWPIGQLFVAHTLDVAELYVRLREAERADRLVLRSFEAEPASWHRAGRAMLKPDAYAVYEQGGWERHLWLEVDRATESLPTMRRKLKHYLDAVTAGDTGPLGVVPVVWITSNTPARASTLDALVDALPPPANQLFAVKDFADLFAPQAPGLRAWPPPPT